MNASDLLLAEQLLAQGLAWWAQFAARKAAGELTPADLIAAAGKLNADLEVLEAEIAARRG